MPLYLVRHAAPLPNDELAAELVAARTVTARWTKGEWLETPLECTEREAERIAALEDVISVRAARGGCHCPVASDSPVSSYGCGRMLGQFHRWCASRITWRRREMTYPRSY